MLGSAVGQPGLREWEDDTEESGNRSKTGGEGSEKQEGNVVRQEKAGKEGKVKMDGKCREKHEDVVRIAVGKVLR